jgi:hypothetical protein
MFPFILEGHLLKGPPASVLFVDIETTGLHGADRIVSLGAIRLPTFEMLTGILQFDQIHSIFDPGRNSHPKAEEVHGYDDWILSLSSHFPITPRHYSILFHLPVLSSRKMLSLMNHFLRVSLRRPGYKCRSCGHIARCRPIEAGVSAEARRFRQSARALRSDNAAKGMTRFKTPGWRCRSIFGCTKACFGKRHFP